VPASVKINSQIEADKLKQRILSRLPRVQKEPIDSITTRLDDIIFSMSRVKMANILDDMKAITIFKPQALNTDKAQSSSTNDIDDKEIISLGTDDTPPGKNKEANSKTKTKTQKKKKDTKVKVPEG